MDPFNLENDKAVLLAEPLTTTIQLSIFDPLLGTSHIFNLTPAQGVQLSQYLFKASVKINTEEVPASKLITG